MSASKLRHRVAFRQEDGTIAFERYAEVMPTSGRQWVSGIAVNAEITHVVTLRYDPSIDKTMTVIFKGRELEIEGAPINVDEANVWLKLTCKEEV